MRAFTMAVLTAACTAIGSAAGPAYATADDVNMSFGMAYGASTTSGTIHFTDGYTATVSGAVHAGERRPQDLRQWFER
ncbi:Secreted protein OS=Streptomyces fumanus OX=67302 GN=GCM10018772_35010 PE=4 SV=1 [Streptomyces fumanus]